MSQSDQPEKATPVEKADPVETRTLKQFLESSPPDSRELVSDRATLRHRQYGGPLAVILPPRLELRCDVCDGSQEAKRWDTTALQ